MNDKTEDTALTPAGVGYTELLSALKERIQQAQVRAGLAVNRELVLLYWQIGQEIVHRQGKEGWGTKVIERLAADLRKAFPEMKGFSARNLKYMRAFAKAYPDEPLVQQGVALIPWGHNVRILDRVREPTEREWYIRQTIEHGWSRDILVHQIESKLYQRQGKALTNFTNTLPSPQSDLARQILKDPYNFDFLTLGKDALEREIERALTDHVRQFLLELGKGFAFLGSQYLIEVDGKDYYIDLLFYHVSLRCYIVIDLKAGEFQPEHAGKLNFYLSAVDDLLRHGDDQPSVGIILCRTKSKMVVEYALRDVTKPIGVSLYHLTEALPEHLNTSLPTIEELEAELSAGREEEE